MTKNPPYDFDGIQKAMEDTERDAFEYFLDRRTGEVIVLSAEIVEHARQFLEETYDEDAEAYDGVELEHVPELPDWAEDEVELVLDIFIHHQGRYERIPERDPALVFEAMRTFTEAVEDKELKEALLQCLEGKGAFRKFKDALGPYPKERKMWYGFNAKAARQESDAWIASLGKGPDTDDDDDTATD